MEKLTEDSVTGETYIKQCASSCPYDGDFCGTDECPVLNAVADKLGEYERAEEHDLLVRLPCKLKDKLYHFYGIDLEDNFADAISDEIIMEVVATEFIIDSYEIAIKCITDWNSPYEYLPASEFGKTVFLTREEAEKKLEEMKK